jgi:hypothetical protein
METRKRWRRKRIHLLCRKCGSRAAWVAFVPMVLQCSVCLDKVSFGDFIAARRSGAWWCCTVKAVKLTVHQAAHREGLMSLG